jgi:hypothetical protein
MVTPKPCHVCGDSNARGYLNFWACPEHTPAKAANRPEPPEGGGAWVLESRRTLPSARGGSDLDKERPGGYVSRQRAERIAQTRDALREQGGQA